jgi:hypothetical protein
VLCVYHFSTFIIRRKRKCDHTDLPQNESSLMGKPSIGRTA